LSSLLRMTLGNIGRQQVRLADELAFVEAYLEIERERFGERLEMRIEVAHETLDAQVPALFLQPLVENCIRHGFAAPAADGVISLGAVRDGPRARQYARTAEAVVRRGTDVLDRATGTAGRARHPDHSLPCCACRGDREP
jgi:hypothetical protein